MSAAPQTKTPLSPQILPTAKKINSKPVLLIEKRKTCKSILKYMPEVDRSFYNEDSSLIELPISLACQLHSYIIESIQRQSELQQDIMDTMIREDEEFARQLQQQEDDLEQKNEEKPAPLLQEIMDMEMALAFYKADQDEWRQQSQNTMAAKLSMQILTQSFPKVDKNVLTDIFHSNNCSLHDTVASLNLALADEQPDLIRKEEELLAKLETVKLQEPERSAIVVTDARDDLNPQQEAAEYRNQAACYYELRNNCFKKAQEAFRSGNTSVASYYSQLAALHKKRTEFFNSQAAACLFHARPKSSTLDLHFLHVAEAVQVLDIFLDEEIADLNHRKKKKSVVFLITGRGLRSVGGVSRIKPIVQRRLRERKIIYNEMNPGMLNAVLTRNTQLTCNI